MKALLLFVVVIVSASAELDNTLVVDEINAVTSAPKIDTIAVSTETGIKSDITKDAVVESTNTNLGIEARMAFDPENARILTSDGRSDMTGVLKDDTPVTSAGVGLKSGILCNDIIDSIDTKTETDTRWGLIPPKLNNDVKNVKNTADSNANKMETTTEQKLFPNIFKELSKTEASILEQRPTTASPNELLNLFDKKPINTEPPKLYPGPAIRAPESPFNLESPSMESQSLSNTEKPTFWDPEKDLGASWTTETPLTSLWTTRKPTTQPPPSLDTLTKEPLAPNKLNVPFPIMTPTEELNKPIFEAPLLMPQQSHEYQVPKPLTPMKTSYEPTKPLTLKETTILPALISEHPGPMISISTVHENGKSEVIVPPVQHLVRDNSQKTLVMEPPRLLPETVLLKEPCILPTINTNPTVLESGHQFLPSVISEPVIETVEPLHNVIREWRPIPLTRITHYDKFYAPPTTTILEEPLHTLTVTLKEQGMPGTCSACCDECGWPQVQIKCCSPNEPCKLCKC